ncbi:hypothetical protein FPV67DRAFT_1355795, partial [Lyophyllum atratum]
FGIVEARIASFFAESVGLGLYLVTFFYTMSALFSTGSRWKRIGELNHAMVTVVLLMFLNTTISSATSVIIVWRGFVLSPPGTVEESFNDISYWATVLKSFVLVFQTTIGDAMLIYRCWVVYAYSWRIIAFSLFLWLGGTVCAVFITYYEATFTQEALVSASKLYPFIVSFWASTVALNVITTALLVLPVWKAARHHEEFALHSSARSRPNTMKQIMRVIIESGLLYTVAAFMTFVTYMSKSNSLYVVSCVVLPIAGIAFNLIIIRTAKATRTTNGTSFGGNTLPLTIMGPR